MNEVFTLWRSVRLDERELKKALANTVGYEICDHTFMVDRIVFTNRLKELRGDRLKLYLFMCKTMGIDNYFSYFHSYDSADKEINISKHHYYKKLQWLTDHFFVKHTKQIKRAFVYEVSFLPVFDGSNYYSRQHINRSRQSFKDEGQGYVELPSDLFKGSLFRNKSIWSDLRIKTLGMLYMYFWIDVYGGIDPSCIYINQVGDYIIDESMYRDVGCTEARFKQNVDFLKREGLLFEHECIYRRNANSDMDEWQYIGDKGEVNQQINDKVIKLLRFKHIPKIKLQNAQLRTGDRVDIS